MYTPVCLSIHLPSVSITMEELMVKAYLYLPIEYESGKE